MTSSPFADDVYQPQDDGGQTGEHFPDMGDALSEPDDDALMESGYSPPERPRVMGRFGTTEAEELRGESLEERLRQEDPDILAYGADDSDGEGERYGGPRAGRILMDGDDCHGRDVGIDGGAASAEEAAMHLVEEE